MPSINNSRLEIVPVEDHPGRRVVVVGYELVPDPDDELTGAEIVETILVHGLGPDDASHPIVVAESTVTVPEEACERAFEQAVHRLELDVEQDWWRTGQGGETQPIAEWVDHLVADIELAVNGSVVDRATTPVVTGSWGALGSD